MLHVICYDYEVDRIIIFLRAHLSNKKGLNWDGKKQLNEEQTSLGPNCVSRVLHSCSCGATSFAFCGAWSKDPTFCTPFEVIGRICVAFVVLMSDNFEKHEEENARGENIVQPDIVDLN